jgi:hypothetical protein
MRHFDTDNPADMAMLMDLQPPERRFEYRKLSRYGSGRAMDRGLRPVEDVPDVLVPTDSFKEVIEHCHAEKIFPMYHQTATWAPPGFQFNQNGLGYCWTWSGTGAVMTTRAMEDKDTVLLAPVSMGYLVGWRNEGNYLEDYIQGARNEGICPAVDGDINSWKNSKSYWAPYEAERAKYRLDAIWDCDNSSDSRMVQHALSCLAYGRPVFIAYNWWAHALHCVGMKWSESASPKCVPIIRNSHNENDYITLEGSKSVFDEAYGFISTVPV